MDGRLFGLSESGDCKITFIGLRAGGDGQVTLLPVAEVPPFSVKAPMPAPIGLSDGGDDQVSLIGLSEGGDSPITLLGFCESGDGQDTLLPTAKVLPSSVEAPVPALNALAHLLECCGVPNALQASIAIASHFGSVVTLLTATGAEIAVRADVSSEVANLVAALGRLHHAAQREEIAELRVIASFDDLSQFALRRLHGCELDEVLVLLLNRKAGLIREHPIRGGTVNHVQHYPREVVRVALLYNASAVVLIQNHSNGDPTPSQSDIEMSRMIGNALTAVGIALHEHLIVGADNVAGIRAMRLL